MKREDVVRRALPLIDLTSLNDDDTPEIIAALCAQAADAGVAAVCIYAPFVPQAVAALAGTGVRVATVANFPAGAPDADAAAREA
ncbi:MAG: deoxyribose-phosphate aldolase, partial [Solirubrobacteraceae bacterium]|nr:deoxyribose-phosphate aldolase [Solirubrobacteraceae bacterium]